MAKYIPTGESAKFEVSLKGVKEGTETATFHIWAQTGTSTEALDELEGEVQGGTASLLWTAKGPPEDGDEREWRVQYRVTVPGPNDEDIEKVSEELIVYNNWLDISSVRAEDGSALPDAAYEIKIGKADPITGSTGESGTFKETALPPGKIKSFRWLKWAQLESWEEQAGVTRKAKLNVSKTAKLVSPQLERKKGVRKLRQWVNLPVDSEKPQLGPQLLLKVKLLEGKAGDKIYIKAIFDDKTKRNDVTRAVVDGVCEDWCKDGTGKIGTLSADDEELEFKIDLGYEGGSKAVIEIGGNENCGDEKLMVTNWRKLTYQVAVPADIKPPSVSRARKALAALYIDLERSGRPVKLSAKGTPDAPAGSWYPGSDHGGKTKRQFLNVSAGKKDWWHDKAFPAGQTTRTSVNIIFCHTNFDTDKAECDHKGRTDSFDMSLLRELGQIEFKGAKAWGMPLAGPAGFYALATSLKDGHPAFKSATWKESLGDRTGEFTAADVEFRSGECLAKFPPEALAVLEEGKQIWVKYELFLAEGPFLGDAGGETGYRILIAASTGDLGTPTHNTTINDVLAHEIGHALNQVANLPAPGLSEPDHGRRYTGNEHYGSHCADGMSDADYGGGSGAGSHAGDFRNAAQCECVMYGQNKAKQSTANGKFCPRCAEFLRAEKLDEI